MNNLPKIESDQLRRIAESLHAKNIAITYYGKAWGKCTNNWIYFDTQLNLRELRDSFNLGSHISEHENLDIKSGMERGFIDEVTGEGLMGKVYADDLWIHTISD